MSRSLVICEEALKNFNGHWFEYSRAVAEMNRADGVNVRILAHRDVEDDVVEAIGAEPFFDYTNWDGIYYHPKAWRRYFGILRHNWRVWKSLSRFYKRQPEKINLVFAPTVVIFHLVAWWFLARRFGGKKIGTIALLVRNSATTYDSSDIRFPRSARILRFVLQRFRKMENVVFLTDSHRLADEYCLLAGMKMTVLPHPCVLTSDAALVSERKSDEIIFLSPGPARWEKGVHVLLDALEKIESPDFRCKIQWPDSVLSPEGTEVEPRSAHCEFLTKPLSSADYSALLGSASCIVLPYLREAYFARISGVAVEAMSLGIPIIFTEDTWIADVVTYHGAGLGFPSGNANALAVCIQEIAQNPTRWKAKAEEKIESARSYFSAKSFQEILWSHRDSSIDSEL